MKTTRHRPKRNPEIDWRKLFDKALKIAVDAHQNQCDRYGQPYILHPIRLMQNVSTMPEKICAILHDVVEDSEWTLKSLKREGFPPPIIKALDCLSKREGEAYRDYVRRAARNSIARQVKLADLEDNMNMTRIDRLKAEDLKRLQKYHDAWRFLQSIH